ncbi:hypothetical protein BH10BAC5_BH10BAC5_25730 [soil metagenome]
MKKIFVILFVTLCTFNGCSFGKKIQDNIIIKDVKEAKYSNGLLNPSFNMKLLVENKNDIDIKIINAKYKISIGEKSLGEGIQNEEVILKKNSVSEYPVKIDISLVNTFLNGLSILENIIGNPSEHIKIEGDMNCETEISILFFSYKIEKNVQINYIK